MSPKTVVKERDILFSAPMVRAILDGRKTQTRRLIDLSKLHHSGRQLWDVSSFAERLWCLNNDPGHLLGVDCPFGPVGRKLWVKENFWIDTRDRERQVTYAATPEISKLKKGKKLVDVGKPRHEVEVALRMGSWKLRPSIFLWRWASRIDLEVTGMKAEIVQMISEPDAIAEGVRWEGDWVSSIAGIMARKTYGTLNPDIQPHQAAYAHLWDELQAESGHGWLKAPHWVWVVEFRKLSERRES